MQLLKISRCLFVSLILFGSLRAEDSIIRSYKTFPSPNGRFTAELETDFALVPGNVSKRAFYTNDNSPAFSLTGGDDSFPDLSTKRSPARINVNYELQIRDRKTGNVFDSKVTTPLYSLKWTGDSEAMVVVSHIAGGSVASIISLVGDRTLHFDAFPPDNGEFCRVIRQEMGWHTTRLTYRVCGTRKGPYSTCAFTIDSRTGMVTRIVTRVIDFKTYCALGP